MAEAIAVKIDDEDLWQRDPNRPDIESAESLPFYKPFMEGLRGYQGYAINKAGDLPGFAYFMEQRTGKTPTAIREVEDKFNRGLIDAVVCCVPKCVLLDWVGSAEREEGFAFWCRVPHYTAHWRPGKQPDQVMTQIGGKFLRVFVINYEAISRTKAARDFLMKIMKTHRTMLIIDESQRVKTPGSKRTKFWLENALDATFVRLLSGTPSETPMDLWSQGSLLRIPRWQKSFFGFRNRYAKTKQRYIPGRKPFTEITGYQRMDELRGILSPYSFRITRAEAWPNAKPKQYKRLAVEMAAEQRRIYNSLAAELRAEIQGQSVVAQIPITKLLRLRQVLGGFVKTEEGNIIALKDNPRLDSLLDYLEDIDCKVIIWANFTAEVEAIFAAVQERFGDAVSYYGEMSHDEKEDAKTQFQYGTARFFVGNPQAGEVGLKLSAAGVAVFYDTPVPLILRQQAEDRGVDEKSDMLIVDMECENSIDGKLIQSLKGKRDIAAGVMGDELLTWL